MLLGITIRKGAEGHTLKSPEGAIDLSPLTRHELGTVGRMVSEAMGLEPRPVEKPARPHRRQFRHHPRNRKG